LKIDFQNGRFALFFKYNFLITALLFTFFMLHLGKTGAMTSILVFAGAVSSAAILYMVLWLLSFLLRPAKRAVLYIFGLLFILIDLGLIVDFFIYRLYKFHINAMVLNIITSPDAMDSLQIGMVPALLFGLFVLLFAAGEFLMIRRLLRMDEARAIAQNRKWNRLILIPIFLIILSEKVTYGIASLTNKNEILTAFRVIPLYQPLTFNKLAAKWFDYKPDVKVQNTIRSDAGIHYPLHSLRIDQNRSKFNIFIFASDAVRYSILSPETAPNITAFEKESLSFEKHYSGGNATRFGIFSLMYGLDATYWFNFLHAAKGSIFFEALRTLGYQISVASSTNTNWPEFRKTCYVDVVNCIKDDFPGAPWQKDKALADYFLGLVDRFDRKHPIFSFVFMDAPHGYSFPPQENRFHAESENINYVTATKGSNEIKSAFAAYKNAIRYDDKQFGKMIAKLKEKGLYDDAMIIFTSDHGQEFYEYGAFGHNSSFSEAQTHIPFIVKLPKSLVGKVHAPKNQMTSHIDVVPTLLHLLGVQNPAEDYSNGHDFFAENFKRDFVFCANWNNNAIITDKYTYIFSNRPDKLFGSEVRDTKTYQKVRQKSDPKLVVKIMNENRRFLK